MPNIEEENDFVMTIQVKFVLPVGQKLMPWILGLEVVRTESNRNYLETCHHIEDCVQRT
jgi:hypothetical protein